MLHRAGIERARGLIAAVGSDTDNVYIVLTARGLRPDLYVIARASTIEAERTLRRAGASRVVSPYLIGGIQMAHAALKPAVVDFLDLATRSQNLDLQMEQVAVGSLSRLVGRTLVEANLRQQFGVIVVAIQRRGGPMDFNPEPEARLEAGDELIVLGRPENLRELEIAAR